MRRFLILGICWFAARGAGAALQLIGRNGKFVSSANNENDFFKKGVSFDKVVTNTLCVLDCSGGDSIAGVNKIFHTDYDRMPGMCLRSIIHLAFECLRML